MSEAPRIHCLAHPLHEQAWNDLQLSRPVQRPALRLWTYYRPGLVLGRSQSTLPTQRPATVRATGGGAVLTGPWMLSVSVVLPIAHALITNSLVESYRWFGLAHQEALSDVGVDATALPPEKLNSIPHRSELDWACFGNCSAWEVVAGTRKIVGLAQRRARTGVLLTSGTLLSDPDWACLEEYLPQRARDAGLLAGRTTSCRRELGRSVSMAQFAQILAAKLLDGVFPAPAHAQPEEALTA